MNDQKGSRETKQARLGYFLRMDTHISFVDDLNPLPKRKLGIMRKLMRVILGIVRMHPEGIVDDKLVEEVRNRGYDCISPVVHRAGKKLVDKGLVKREEWYESFFDGAYRSSVTRYKYFPAGHE
jgi:hypothetical protein